jgi:hypothetical protein
MPAAIASPPHDAANAVEQMTAHLGREAAHRQLQPRLV